MSSSAILLQKEVKKKWSNYMKLVFLCSKDDWIRQFHMAYPDEIFIVFYVAMVS